MESDIADKQGTLSSEQLDAVNSGITTEDVSQINTNKTNILNEQAKTKGMSEGGSNYITVNNRRIYVGARPTDARVGDFWLGEENG
jgi:hypothetical protein